MKAIKKFLALLLTAVMAFTVVPVFAAQSSSVPEKALSAGRLYGYRVFDDDDTLSYAWISFTTDNPAAVTEEQVEENAFDKRICLRFCRKRVFLPCQHRRLEPRKAFCRCKQL
jgi:hypothetical protein